MHPRARIWKASSIVFVVGACTMILELVAGRILAPYVGVSLYTWTSIIGVVLAGISLGNYLGGRIADRHASNEVLGAIILAGGVTSLGVLAATVVVNDHPLPSSLHVMVRIVIYTIFLFFIPASILGMVTPMVIKLALKGLEETGNIVGTIYAYSCAGSILGTFATGFLLISWLGTRRIIWLVALTLLATAILCLAPWRRRKWPWLAIIAVLGLYGFGFQWRESLDRSLCDKESNYYCIRIGNGEIGGTNVKILTMDRLVHSYVDVDDPTFLAYPYENIFSEITWYVTRERPIQRALFIGGGGYTFPRYLEVFFPESRIEVVEIDPAVTKIARLELGLPRDTKIRTYNQDARLFFIEGVSTGRYDLIIGDAFNDFSVPYHLTTFEFNEQIRSHLAEGGFYVVNLIDSYKEGRFLRAYINTLKRSFNNVYLFAPGQLWEASNPATYVVAAGQSSIDFDEFRKIISNGGSKPMYSVMLEQNRLDEYLDRGQRLILTDDYAPVDNMIAPLFTR